MKNTQPKPKTPFSPPRIGISRCLLGEEVRYDGGHKRDAFLTHTFSPFVEWVPVCPEAEAGLGIPREAMRLVDDADTPRLVTIKTNQDHTTLLNAYAKKKIHDLASMELDGFVFKKDSPSCGIDRVRIYNELGMPTRMGRGLFAAAFIEKFPLVPVEEEGRLNDPLLRDNFIERVFCYHRWRTLSQSRMTRRALVEFHTQHKLLVLAHSPPHYQELGRIVANAKQFSPTELKVVYGTQFMEALKTKATVRKHVNVLQHIAGYFKTYLSNEARRELGDIIKDYHQELIPLVVPLTLINHYVKLHRIPYLLDQVYLNPHPKELMLRNHV